MPYYGYSRQDRKAAPRQPISAKLMADLLQTAGATRLMCLDLHADQIQGFSIYLLIIFSTSNFSRLFCKRKN